jgi:L-threonylcarbamoyladenylate synthase
MKKPDFIIDKEQRTYGGALPTSRVQQVRSKLMRRGFVLLPSDTCYSLATLAVDEDSRNNVNAILDRKEGPISLAFSSYLEVQRFVELDNTAAMLLERFTPGPITVVCKAKDDPSKKSLAQIIGSPDGTIGVRIPDSSIERDIAACTQYILMSVAVRYRNTRDAIQDFAHALEVVGEGIARFGGAGWAAVEGDAFYSRHSTVVRVGGTERVKLLREGDIPLDEILSAVNSISGLAMEDWG